MGINNGLALYLPVDEGSGSTTYDESGNSNNGTIYGAPTWANGKYGKALSFNGSTDYVTIPTSSSLDATHWTISMWCRLLSIPASGMQGDIIARRNDSNDRGFVWEIYDTGVVHFWVHDSGGWKENQWSFPDLTNFYHIVQVCNGTNIILYINGVQYDIDACGDNTVPTGWPLRIGCNSFILNKFANAIIDEVRIYNRTLSADEVRALYTAPYIAFVMIDGYPLNIIPNTWQRKQIPIAPTWDRWDQATSKAKRVHGANVGYIDAWIVQCFEDANAVTWANSAANHFESCVAIGKEVPLLYSFVTSVVVESLGVGGGSYVYVLSCVVTYDEALSTRYFTLTIRAF